MVKSRKFELFKELVLEGRPNSNEKICMPKRILNSQIEEIIGDISSNVSDVVNQFIQIEFEKFLQRSDIAEHLGLDKDVEKIKSEFLFEVKKDLKEFLK